MAEIEKNIHRLYHYTTQQGLLGILENNCLWATHYKFLNDYSEIVKFKKKLIQHLSSKDFGEERKRRENVCKPLIDDLYSFLTNEIYIASFSSQYDENSVSYNNVNGLLSQWRAYGEDGGFAIVLKKNDLDELINSELASFSYKSLFVDKVIYSDGREMTHDFLYEELKKPGIGGGCDDTQDYEVAFSEQLNLIENFIFEEKSYQEKESQINQVCLALIQCITRYKDHGFQEEREFRVVALPDFSINSQGKKRNFRCKNGEQIPYIELFKTFSSPNSDNAINSTLQIERIIVGPHKNAEARANWLCLKLADMGRNDISVYISGIPYIGR